MLFFFFLDFQNLNIAIRCAVVNKKTQKPLSGRWCCCCG